MSRAILISHAANAIRAHGERSYPEECCGFLIARSRGGNGEGPREIHRVLEAENRVAGERRRRFVIYPEEVARIEREVEKDGEALVGFYHSHPDQPPEPSGFDEEHAWPWYTYVILSVAAGRAGPMGAFELGAADRKFRPIEFNVRTMPERTDSPRGVAPDLTRESEWLR